MLVPCEFAARSVIPALKALVAQELDRSYHLKQHKIASLLHVTQPAVCQYLRNLRGKAIDLSSIEEMRTMVIKTAKGLATSTITDRPEVLSYLSNCPKKGDYMREEDKELKKIKLKKLREMMNWSASKKQQRKSVTNTPVDLTNKTLTEAVHEHSLVVVDCWAPWCGPCHIVSPIIEELARDYSGKIFVGKLNVDENRKIAMQYQIMSIPTLLVFKNGRLVDRLIGAMPRQMLEPRIIRHL